MKTPFIEVPLKTPFIEVPLKILGFERGLESESNELSRSWDSSKTQSFSVRVSPSLPLFLSNFLFRKIKLKRRKKKKRVTEKHRERKENTRADTHEACDDERARERGAEGVVGMKLGRWEKER